MTQAEQRRLGVDGPWVSPVGLGCMGMSATYGPADDAGCTTTLLRALDLGVTHFDTADLYGRGHNERLLGRTLRARRDEFVLATKFGYRFTDDSENAARFVDSSGDWARQACEESLRRLSTDAVDLFYLHRRNPGTPIEETVSAMADLVHAGKARWLGLSEVSPDTLRRADTVHPIAAVQMEYSLFTRSVEAEMLATCRELGVALVAYAPVGRGWLARALQHDGLESGDTRQSHPRFAGDALTRNRALVAEVVAVAAEIGVTPAQAALAWLLAQGPDVLPIPGTRRVSHLAENLTAADVELTRVQLARLTDAVPLGAVAGERHNASNLDTLGH